MESEIDLRAEDCAMCYRLDTCEVGKLVMKNKIFADLGAIDLQPKLSIRKIRSGKYCLK